MSNNKILVLMSTYNGERYLRQQIDSILGQRDVAVGLLVRDDGSTDRTLAILDEYKAKGLLDYYQGENLKPARSFMHLLQNAPTSDYYAFADQDDVWLPEKLSVAVNNLKEHENEPALYFCQTQLVDKDLNKMDNVTINPLLTFGETLIYKYVSGCTMIFNNKLRNVIGLKQPQYIHMHDAWIYLIAQAVSAYVYFDPTPYILYRQHSNNVLGLDNGFIPKWKLRLHHLLHVKNERYNQALALNQCYYDVIKERNKQTLNLFLQGKRSILKRLRIIFNKNLRCSDTTTQRLFWCNVLLNKY